MKIEPLLINFIVYFIFILPIIFIIFFNKTYLSKQKTFVFLAISFIIEIIISLFLYLHSYIFFSLFTHSIGLINLCVYYYRILFLDSPLFGLKLLIPAHLLYKNKKTAILILSKIAVNIIFILLSCFIPNSAIFLYTFPTCNFLYYIIYSILFFKYC